MSTATWPPAPARPRQLGPESAIYTMSARHRPALTIDPGETVEIRTVDCYGGVLTEDPRTYGAIDAPLRNPATGPVAVRGAQPGDTLGIEILAIRLPESGTMVLRPGVGLLGEPGEPPIVRRVELSNGHVQLAGSLALPSRPMIGVLGVAPAAGEISNRDPGDHGGNMDTQDVCPGSRVSLRVQVPGGLFALGDVKAAMGDGESTGTGVEVSARVRLRVTLQEGTLLPRPFIETATALVTIASDVSLRRAMRLACADMAALVAARWGLPDQLAACIVGGWADLRISQVVNPLATVRYVLPKAALASLGRENDWRASTE